VASRHSGILICVLRTEEDLGLLDNAMGSLEAGRESVVTFGPWKATPSVADLLDCIRMDVESRGYRVAILPEPAVRASLFRSYDCFFSSPSAAFLRTSVGSLIARDASSYPAAALLQRHMHQLHIYIYMYIYMLA
jgi:hypothetical protein